jgi:predicted O-methyltransferase YrrM
MTLRNRKRTIPVRARSLELLIKEHGVRTGVELGVLDGRTFNYLLHTCPDLSLTGVDIWEVQHEKDEKFKQGGRSYDGWDMANLYFQARSIANRYPGRARLIRKRTVDAAPDFEDGSLDFVFIDADHLYESVRADIIAWWPKIKKGGLLTGHDYAAENFPGVTAAVHELVGEPDVHDGHVWSCVT